MAYVEWGAVDNPHVLLCVHGLTRNGRDFDRLAESLSLHYRVICPDVVGRGRSAQLRDPAAYGLAQYVADMVTLIARLNVSSVHWLGTSMGGLIGMALAALDGSPISKLLLNDVGPVITLESLRRIATYVGADPAWASFEQALDYVKRVSAPFGSLNQADWLHLTEHSVRQDADGQWRFRYDPAIAAPFKASFVDRDIDLWPLYERISCPTLVLRGAHSDLLTPDTWREMGRRGPCAELAEIPGVGHAPMFLDAAQISLARDFFLAP
jgi:pimeloyl-ACP methyl ester carboxylesterase